MFQFPSFPFYDYVFIIEYTGFSLCEFPHSDIYGSYACLQLTIAFRSLPRPSSAPGA